MFPKKKNKKSQIQPWSLTWNLTNQALQGQGIPLWRNIHFQVPGCCLSTLQLAANFNEAGD